LVSEARKSVVRPPVLSYRPVIRVLHIARYGIIPVERRVMEMAADPGCVFRLVRPLRRPGPIDAHLIRDPARFEHIRQVRIWSSWDPHRGVYRTVGFGMRAAAPDIIHAEEEPDGLAALHVAAARRVFAPRARLVLNTWQNVNRRKRAPVAWVLRRTLAAADAVVCGNQGAVRVLRELGYHRPAPVIPALVLDPSVFCRRPVPRLAGAFTVGYAGRLVPEKGVDLLIRAVAAIGVPAALYVVGAGPSRPALESLARDLGIGDAVRFLGPRDAPGIADFLSSVDVLVVPSQSTAVWQEQFCRVAVEAMGCETPVVGADSGAIGEVLGDAGLLFPEGDAEALAGHLRRLRASPALRADLARRGLERGRSAHSPAVRAARTIEFYRSLLEEPARGSVR
jgi:glycosyltransferase involved in cell wall biosynthesis